jgi:hypothetical protein
MEVVMSRIKLIRCPMCGGKMEVDLNTGTVYRHFEKKSKDQIDGVFSGALDKVAGKDDRLDRLFSKAKEKEKNKDLDDLFRKAAEKTKDVEDEPEEQP